MTARNTPHTRDGFLWSHDGSTTGLTTEAVVPTRITKKNYDVIVIGAGFAGLTAARDITERSGSNVLVLEARDRIGGRTWTAKAFDMDVEMGGTWIHWHQPHVWTEIHRYNLQRGIKTSASAEEAYCRSADGKVELIPISKYNTLINNILDEFFKIDGHTARTLMPYPHDPFREPAPWKAYDSLSVQNRLDQMARTGSFDRKDLDMFKNITSGVSLATPDRTGFVEFLRWIALGGYSLQGLADTTAMYKLGNGGMTSLARNMLGDYKGDIMFDAAVTNITQEPGQKKGVNVTLKDGRSIQATQVISTIPLNVLKSINFVPNLPLQHQKAIEVGQIGRGYKIHYKTSQPSTPWVAFASQEGSSPFNAGVSDNTEINPNQSSHFVAFGLADTIADVQDHKTVIAHFDNYMNAVPERKVAGYLCHDWSADPFSQGTWCAFGPGGNVKYHQELQKSHGKVLFASSDWASGWKGFVDGAIEEGKKAALQVLSSIDR